MKIKESTYNKLMTAYEFCEQYEKSTEFMLQYLQDFANVSLDTVIDFLTRQNPSKFQKAKKEA